MISTVARAKITHIGMRFFYFLFLHFLLSVPIGAIQRTSLQLTGTLVATFTYTD